MKRFLMLATTLMVALSTNAIVRADVPASMPSLVDVTDKAAVTAAMDSDVELQGTVSSADMSPSGKVMFINFKGADDTRVEAIIFDKKKEAIDKAFSGDVGKTLTGALVKIRGHLKDFKGKPEVIIDQASQITVITPASATQP